MGVWAAILFGNRVRIRGDSPLSRALASEESVAAFARWQTSEAEHGTADGSEFGAGLEEGLRALYGSDERSSTAQLLDIAASEQTTDTSRINWLLGLKAATSKARYRGQLAAEVILSGADEWRGIADDVDLAVNGPSQDPPRRGAWPSLA